MLEEVLSSPDLLMNLGQYRVDLASPPKTVDRTGQTLQPLDNRHTPPAVLLHSFFAKDFDSMPDAVENNNLIERCRRIGAPFLLAQVIVHEMAHCFNLFPEIKKADGQGEVTEVFADEEEARFMQEHGYLPECGQSWQRSMFTNHEVVLFANFETGDTQGD